MKSISDMNLAEVTLVILGAAVNIPDGMYARAQYLAKQEMRALLDKEVDGNSHAPKHQGVPPLIATLHENGELIAAQATIAQQAKLIELLKGEGQGEPVAWLNIATGHVTTSAVVVMDWDDEKEQVQSLYAEQPAPVAVDAEILERFPEINFANYGQDEVEALQAWAFEAYEAIARLNGVSA